MASLIGSDGRAGVYWRGSDGNIYTRNNLGQINKSGSGAGVLAPGDQTFGGLRFREIANPSPSQPAASSQAPAPSNPNGGGGGGGSAGPQRADRSNSIAMNMAGLGAVDRQTAAGLAAIDRAFRQLTGQYDEETAANEKMYGTQSDTNQVNLQKNKQAGLANAAQGRRGLFGVLSSLGALNGSGIDLANDAVKKGANADLSEASDTFGENQSMLDTAIGTFRREDKTRRENANSSADNARTNVRGDAAKTRMNLYTSLANDFSQQLDEGNARKYTDLAASLYPEIARSNVPNANIAYTGAAFTPGSLQNYIAGADSTQVTTTPNTPGAPGVPGLVARPNKKKQTQLV